MASIDRVLIAALAVLVATAPAEAWTGPTRTRMLDDALRLSPPALSELLSGHQDDCRAAAVSGHPGGEETHAWTTPQAREEAGETLERTVRDVIRGIGSHKKIEELCGEAGRIAHLIADLNEAPRTGMPTSGALPPDARDEFDRYAESVVKRAPLVFWGWRDDLGAPSDIPRLAVEIAARSARDADGLREAFFPAGRRVRASTFDDRSVPFAVASLSYSRAVSDLANVFYLVWKEAGGDLAGTPYRKRGAARQPATNKPISNEDLH